MTNVLIIHPEKFNCYSKLKRKIEALTKNLNDVVICMEGSNNKLTKKLKNDNFSLSLVDTTKEDTFTKVSHAIIFDDGNFKGEIEKLKNNKVPIRIIKIKITSVVNINKCGNKEDNENYEYIGRGSYWGNPYSMFEDGNDRNEVIRKYKYDFDFDKFPNKDISEVHKLAGKNLGCFCKPLLCHGDVLADYLNSYDDGK